MLDRASTEMQSAAVRWKILQRDLMGMGRGTEVKATAASAVRRVASSATLWRARHLDTL